MPTKCSKNLGLFAWPDMVNVFFKTMRWNWMISHGTPDHLSTHTGWKMLAFIIKIFVAVVFLSNWCSCTFLLTQICIGHLSFFHNRCKCALNPQICGCVWNEPDLLQTLTIRLLMSFFWALSLTHFQFIDFEEAGVWLLLRKLVDWMLAAASLELCTDELQGGTAAGLCSCWMCSSCSGGSSLAQIQREWRAE